MKKLKKPAKPKKFTVRKVTVEKQTFDKVLGKLIGSQPVKRNTNPPQ